MKQEVPVVGQMTSREHIEMAASFQQIYKTFIIMKRRSKFPKDNHLFIDDKSVLL